MNTRSSAASAVALVLAMAASFVLPTAVSGQESVMVTFEDPLATELGLAAPTTLALPLEIAQEVCLEIVSGSCTANSSSDNLVAYLAEQDGDDGNSARDFAPGQRAKAEGGAATDYAPGQVKEDGESGRDHAPGQQKNQ